MTSLRMLLLALALALVLPPAAQADKPGKPVKPPKRLLVSLGDSYSTGYQPSAPGVAGNTRNGFAYQVPKLARKRGYRFRLVNFGCAGETTVSLLQRTTPCAIKTLDGPDYSGQTQVAAAEAFVRANRRKVGLITMSIGGNDATACAAQPDPVPCVAAAVEQLKQNVGAVAQRLRAAAGRKVPIVGIAYPDVILGRWIGADANQDLARLSVVAFRRLINPALQGAYAAAGGKLVDVTAATGAYGSLDQLTQLDPYGLVPVPVARVCKLTYFCEFRDIHARTSGYRLIAKLVAKTLPRRT
jgi:lysophospholipase L1-like esterase